MACIKHIYTCSFLLAVIVGHVILCVEGRPMKALTKENHGKETIDAKPIPAGQPSDLPGTGPIPSYDVSGERENLFPSSANGTPEFGDSLTAHSTDFRPTPPGKSPGIGHPPRGRKQDDLQHSPSSTPSPNQSLAAETRDFRPTGPGRSPGVGHHSFQIKNREPNA